MSKLKQQQDTKASKQASKKAASKQAKTNKIKQHQKPATTCINKQQQASKQRQKTNPKVKAKASKQASKQANIKQTSTNNQMQAT